MTAMKSPYINWLTENNFLPANNDTQEAQESDELSFVAPLTDYALISIKGVDAEKFMQGQFSCDVSSVNNNTSRLGTANTPKGRAYAAFRIAKHGDDYLIRLPLALAPDFLSRLNKYIVFSKAELALEEQLFPLGIVGQGAANMLKSLLSQIPSDIDQVVQHSDSLLIRVPGEHPPRYEAWCTPSVAEHLLTWQKEQSKSKQEHSQADWYRFELTEGIAEVLPETQESFIPQMLNLQQLNAISFTKGCYTGQEIIARMKYLGKLKKAMFLLSSTPATKVFPGDPVWSDDRTKKLGAVVRTISTQKTTLTLAVLDIESVNSGNGFALLSEGNEDTKLLTLPYRITE